MTTRSTSSTSKPKTPKPEPRWRFTDTDHEEVTASHRLYRYRFLFADATCLDVIAPWDDSDLRGAVLELRRQTDDRIVGVSDGVPVGWSEVAP